MGAYDQQEWRLIATWKQQKSETRYLHDLYSFVENFRAETGNRLFKGVYGNQWVRTTGGQWRQVTKAKYSTTAVRNSRIDYGAGTKGDAFFMYAGGFQNTKPTREGARFTRRPGKRPDIPSELLK